MMFLISVLLGLFGGGLAGGAVAFAAKKLVPRLWGWLVIILSAGLTSYAALWASIDYAQTYILADPGYTGEGGPSAMVTVLSFAGNVALMALIGSAAGAKLVLWWLAKS